MRPNSPTPEVSAGDNIELGDTCHLQTSLDDQANTDPLLESLATNNGTPTHKLKQTSPRSTAAESGRDADLDQRDVERGDWRGSPDRTPRLPPRPSATSARWAQNGGPAVEVAFAPLPTLRGGASLRRMFIPPLLRSPRDRRHRSGRVDLVREPGCFGSFVLTQRVYHWNQTVDPNKFAKWELFVATIIVPIYPSATIFDVIFTNSVEFWSGRNPVGPGPTTARCTPRPADVSLQPRGFWRDRRRDCSPDRR